MLSVAVFLLQPCWSLDSTDGNGDSGIVLQQKEGEKDRKAKEEQEPVNLIENLATTGPVIPPAQEQIIDLGSALRLAEAVNPTIAISRQAIQEALANQLRAKSLLLPSLRAGMNYHLHNGVLQTSFGEMRRVNSRSFYLGGGARTLAAETVAFPAVQIFSPLGDALFEPLAARQLVAAKNAQAAAVANSVLLEVASRYLDLVAAEAELAAVRESEVEMNRIVQITANFAKTGQGRQGDANRARSEALLLHTEEQHAEEQVAVAAAELARVLHLDPSVHLRTPAGAIGIVELVDPNQELGQLLEIVQNSRPELAALRAEIARKQTQVRQERLRPLFPTISIGFSSGTFGGGTNRTDLVSVHPEFGRFGGRTDFDAMAFWTLQNLGVGNLALQNQRRAERDLTIIEQARMLTRIRREVTDAYALSAARRQQVEINQRRLLTAEAGFREDYRRIRGGVGLPIEVLNSMSLLIRAREQLIRSTLEYDRAQFELFVGLGQPPVPATPK